MRSTETPPAGDDFSLRAGLGAQHIERDQLPLMDGRELDRYTGRTENSVHVAQGERSRIAVLGARTRAKAIQRQPAKGAPRRGISRASPRLVGCCVLLLALGLPRVVAAQ